MSLSKEDYKLFVRDALNNNIVVGGKCKNNCSFCSCKAQASAGLKNWTDYISVDDLESIIDYINPNKEIFFGEGIQFLSCEPFQHPNFLDLLSKLNEYFPNTKKRTTTVCKNIPKESYKKIINSGLKIVAGVNTLDPDKRKEIMESKDDYYGVLNFLKGCEKAIDKVSLLYTGDFNVLKSDIEKLYKINPSYKRKEIMLRLPDYSIHHKESVKELHYYAKETWHDAVRYFDKVVENPSYWIRSLTDFPDDVSYSEIDSIYSIHYARKKFEHNILTALEYFDENLINPNEVGFLLAESVYDYFILKFPELKENAIKVINYNFGGSYIVAPLLTKNDFVNAIYKHDKVYDSYIAPLKTFTYYNKDIMGNHALRDYPFNLYLI